MIEQEKALEYQQVAAILALEIEIKHDMVHNHDDWTKEQLIEIFDMLAEERQKLIEDAEYRQQKYGTMCMLFNLPVRSDEDGED